MTGPNEPAPPYIIARLDAELSELRSALARFLAKGPYHVRLKHDTDTGQYVLRHDGPGDPIPDAVLQAAERFFADLLDAHERGYGKPSPDWEALALVKGRMAEVLEPTIVAEGTKLIFRDVEGRNDFIIGGPFGDQKVIASGTVHPTTAKIKYVVMFEIAFKEGGGSTGPLGGRVVIDFANALYQEVREAVAN
jgi:hypothetical protein